MTTEELQKLLNAATPGPWRVDSDYDAEIVTERGVKVSSAWSKEDMGKRIIIGRKCVPDRHYKPNARLIALAPTLARKVIAAEKLVEALQVARDNEDIEGMFFAIAAWEAGE